MHLHTLKVTTMPYFNTVVVCWAVLFVELRSLTLEVTEAVLVTVPGCCGFTTRAIVAEAPLAIVPMSQVTVVAPFAFEIMQVPWLGVADPNMRCADRGSVTMTPVAATDGARL